MVVTYLWDCISGKGVSAFVVPILHENGVSSVTISMEERIMGSYYDNIHLHTTDRTRVEEA